MAKNQKPYTREQCEFVSPEGILSFPSLEPGAAKAIEAKEGGFSYKCEGVFEAIPTEGAESSLYKAAQIVAWYEDQANWSAHLFGRDGRFPRLHFPETPMQNREMPKRDASVYPYAVNKHMVTFSATYYPHTVGMKGANLADPVTKQRYETVIAAKAPGVVKFCNPANPAEVQHVLEESEKRRLSGLPPIAEADYGKTLIKLQPHEYWPGCYVKIAGRAFWSTQHKTVLLALTHVLFVKEGERLTGGEKSPDSVFGAFAPPSSLAPTPPGAPPPPPPMPVAAKSAWAV